MSHATVASRSSFRRRGRGASSSSAMAVDSRYRSAVVRRRPQALPVPDAEPEAWPNWLVPSALTAVMATISAYHFDALLAALRALILN